MLAPRRGSVASQPPHSPLSPAYHPSSIPRPHSVTGHSGMSRVASSEVVMQNDGIESEGRNVRVVLRIKPHNPNDTVAPPRFRGTSIHPTSPTEVRVEADPAVLAGQAMGTGGGPKRNQHYTFDHVLGEAAGQEELFDCSGRNVVDDFIKGHNVTFLAYGQTSSGKSYSMGTTGEEVDYSGSQFTPRTGLIPRTVQTIFEKAEEMRLSSGSGSSWECRLSFLELYNEEIIDLLSGGGVQIAIREERDGRIVWSGVREVKVRTLEEVMDLLQEGSTRRKTGATGMNATSSRSHAIFSLTLIQRKRATAGVTASTSQPLRKENINRAETPTRLKRPSSLVGISNLRSNTPTGGRSTAGPPTSFPGSNNKSGIPQRSSMQFTSSDDFMVVTSKFNMVDLAGSERLKRTAAHGDRMKEGISINSGLLALGNVISTLAEPAKTRGHIPYRDSKLTRMLQDSIGGNAITTMIACVSGIEFNLVETLNTIKYAARARNIKNSAKINAVEAGWDDVEHLQTTVIKLRKQLAEIAEDPRSVPSAGVNGQSEENARQSKELMRRLADLQREHTELHDQYLIKCGDNIRLTGEMKALKPGDGDALQKYNETVEPVILEYEKVVSSLNQQLEDLRAEISMMNDLYDQQSQVLEQSKAQQAEQESYVVELRGRVAKLTERNTSSEAYIQDMESKLKAQAEAEETRNDAASDLRKEIAKLKEANTSLSQHATEIESRLAKAESHTSDLLKQIEKQEKEAEKRDAAYRDLEERAKLLDTSDDSKLLLSELEERDGRISELESKLSESTHGSEGDKSRLTAELQGEKSLRAELSQQITDLRASIKADSMRSPRVHQLTPPETPESRSDSPQQMGQERPNDEVTRLRTALEELSARCDHAETKYSEAEHKIAELNNQLSEARLIHAELDDIVPSSSSHGDESSDGGTTLETPKILSPELSPTRSRRGSMPVMIKASGSGFRGGRGYGESSRARPLSLSQELSSAQSSASSLRASWSTNSLLLGSSPTRQSMPPMAHPQANGQGQSIRSSTSFEAELKFVHKVVDERDEELRDREAYIKHLEELLRQSQHQPSHSIPSRKNSANSLHPLSAVPSRSNSRSPSPIPILFPAQARSGSLSPKAEDFPLPPTPNTSSPFLVPPSADPITPTKNGLKPVTALAHLSPISTKRFNDLKESLDQLENGEIDVQASQGQVDGLMKEMAIKEASQRQIIEQQFIQIADLQKANNKLREALATGNPAIAALNDEIQSLRKSQSSMSISDLSTSSHSPNSVVSKLREQHGDEMEAVMKSHAETVTLLTSEHSAAVEDLRNQMSSVQTEHEKAISDLQTARDSAFAELETAHKKALEALQKDNEALLKEVESSVSTNEEQRRQLKMKADQAMFELSRLRDEHQIQRTADIKQISELARSKATLEQTVAELEGIRTELKKRNSDLESRFSSSNGSHGTRRPSGIVHPPPSGPPPNLPLPPLPPSATSRASPSTEQEHLRESMSSSTGHAGTIRFDGSQNGHGLNRSEVGHDDDDEWVNERENMRRMVEESQEIKAVAEHQLQEQVTKAENLVRELADARKTNSKLRAHLEDARQDNKRQLEICKDHTSELLDRRSKMSEITESRRSDRDSLMVATAQVATLKAQLEKAMDTKVNKKMGSRMKCF